MELNCIFEIPLQEATTGDFEFSQMNCSSSLFELTQNVASPTKEFYIQKTLNYGDILILWFLTLFSILIITKGIFGFFWKK